MHIFGIKAPFFLLDTLSTFNAIIGFDLLTQAAKIRYGNATEQLKFFDCPNVNFVDKKYLLYRLPVIKNFVREVKREIESESEEE